MRSLRAGVTLALAALALSIPASAAAEPDRIQLSLDGASWASTLAEPLLGEAPVLVPLDTVTRSFYVRNGSQVPAAASLDLVAPAKPSKLDEHLRVTWGFGDIASTGTVGTITRGRCSTTVTGPTLLPDEWQRVDVAIGLPDLAGRTAQGSSTDLSLVVRLTQVVPPGAVTVCEEGAGGPPRPVLPAVPAPPAATPPYTPPVTTPVTGPPAAAPCAGAEVVLVGKGRTGCPPAAGPGRPAGGSPQVAGVAAERPTSQVAGAAAERPNLPGTSSGLLPSTGSPTGVVETALLGAGCVGVGALLMSVRRRGKCSQG